MITGSSTGTVDVMHSTGDVMASLMLKEVLASCSANILMTQDGIDKIGGITAFSETCDSLIHPLRFALAASDLTEGECDSRGKEETTAVEEPPPAKVKGKKASQTEKSIKDTSDHQGSSSKPTSDPKVKSVVAVLEYWPSTTPPLSAVAINSNTPTSANSDVGGLRRRSASSAVATVGDGSNLTTPERGGGVGSRKRSLTSPAPIGGASARLSLVCAGLVEGAAAITRLTLSPDGRWLGLSGADGHFTMHTLPPRPKVLLLLFKLLYSHLMLCSL
jgi:hypothetical protein